MLLYNGTEPETKWLQRKLFNHTAMKLNQISHIKWLLNTSLPRQIINPIKVCYSSETAVQLSCLVIIRMKILVYYTSTV